MNYKILRGATPEDIAEQIESIQSTLFPCIWGSIQIDLENNTYFMLISYIEPMPLI